MNQENAAPSSLSAYDVSAGLFVRGLTHLKGLLAKAEAHAAATGSSEATLIDAQLAADMNNLGVQVHWAAEGAKLAMARLLGLAVAPPPAPPDDAKSLADLVQRIDAVIAYLSAIAPHDLDAGIGRVIEIPHRGATRRFSGGQFLVEFAIPNFYFHMTSAYGILRHKGVELTKGDFLGGWG